jgi:RNA polymerase sigma-70 factor (ECF subfamily)
MVLKPLVADESDLLVQLRNRDPDALGELVNAWSPGMLALARVPGAPTAVQLVQRAWLTAIERLDAYPGRPGLRAWVFGILIELVLAGGRLPVPDKLITEPCVDRARFRGPDDKWPGGWTPDGVPAPWDRTRTSSAAGIAGGTLDRLPLGSRVVVTLRDVCGFTVDEVAGMVGLSPADVRLLLHSGRSRIRAALEERYGETMAVGS